MPFAGPFAVTLLLVAVGYVGFVGALAWRVRRPTAAPAPFDVLPRVAIVVAARDEEAHLPRCIDALRQQSYPHDRIEIWIADDHSQDRTAAVVQDAAEASDEISVRYLKVPDPEGGLRGKAQALHTAFEAIGRQPEPADVVLITDADCAPVPTWTRRMASRFSDTDTGLVCGIARVTPRAGRPFDRAQALDWMLMLGAASGLAESGFTATGMGNNMAVRRETYEHIGGYPALPFSVTEDFTLVQAVAERSPWRVRFPIDPEATVWTLPADGLANAYAQRRRWARGGLSGGGWVVATYGLLFAVHALPIVGLAIAPAAAAVSLVLKTLGDVLFLTTVAGRAGVRRPLWEVARDALGFEAFLYAYMATLPFVLMLRPPHRLEGAAALACCSPGCELPALLRRSLSRIGRGRQTTSHPPRL